MALFIKPVDRTELTQALQALRSRWPASWPGLARVYRACLRRLGHGQQLRFRTVGELPTSRAIHRFQVLYRAAMAVARFTETRSRRGEPSYHNRLHTADTMVSMTALLSQTPTLQCESSYCSTHPQPGLQADQSAFMVLVMLCHDLLHRGKINRFPFENERHTLEYVLPVLRREGVTAADQQRIKRLILHTDPAICAKNHQQTIQRPLSLADKALQQVLVNEADISASVLPAFAQTQGQALADEWNDDFPDVAAGVKSLQGRLHFLESTALFSSPQALKLELHRLRSDQVCELRSLLVATPKE